MKGTHVKAGVRDRGRVEVAENRLEGDNRGEVSEPLLVLPVRDTRHDTRLEVGRDLIERLSLGRGRGWS